MLLMITPILTIPMSEEAAGWTSRRIACNFTGTLASNAGTVLYFAAGFLMLTTSYMPYC